MYRIDFHADDYAISPNNCRRILELVKNGHLDSFSIIANMSCYDECMDILRNEWENLPIKPMISVHVNLIGGLNISGAGHQFESWGSLLKASCMPGRRKLKEELVSEISAQISRVYTDVSALPGAGDGLRLDSHVHTHMIPFVFDAMMSSVKKLGLMGKLEYVRLSREPFFIFFRTPGVTGTFPAVNAIKNIILNIFSFRADSILTKMGVEHGLLWGLMLSGRMDADRMKLLLPGMTKLAAGKDVYLEILGHPGIVLPSEALPEFGPDDKKAFLSENRNTEYEGMVECANENTLCK